MSGTEIRNVFDRPYIKGDIQLTKYYGGDCSGGVGCLNIG